MTETGSPPRKRLRCWVGMHKWVLRVNEEERYYSCRYCGKYHETAHAIMRYPGSRP